MTRHCIAWDDVPELGVVPDSELARRLGVTRRAVQHARAVRGLASPRKRGQRPGTDHARSVLTAAQVRRVHRLARQGWSQRDIAGWLAEELGREHVAHTWVGRILRGEIYAELAPKE